MDWWSETTDEMEWKMKSNFDFWASSLAPSPHKVLITVHSSYLAIGRVTPHSRREFFIHDEGMKRMSFRKSKINHL